MEAPNLTTRQVTPIARGMGNLDLFYLGFDRYSRKRSHCFSEHTSFLAV